MAVLRVAMGQITPSPKTLPWVPLILGSGVIFFILSSHPMLRPGFDAWWHLGMIDEPSQANASKFPPIRIAWHHLWHQIFQWLSIQDVFQRALIIHRTQFLLTAVLLTVSAFLVMTVLTAPRPPAKSSLWTASLLACVIWFLMHGTYSTARGGGHGAAQVLSWPLWYSINYQISLPLYFAATACLLFGIAGSGRRRPSGYWLLAALCLIGVGTVIHAAETAYFLVGVLLIALLYVRGKTITRFLLTLTAIAGVTYWLASYQSYIAPAFISNWSNSGLQETLRETRRVGSFLVNSGLNRMDTSWHAMHWMSVIVLLALGAYALLPNNLQAPIVDRKALLFILLTALCPAALATPWGAGLFAQITHQHIAWRFSLASFLFIALPLCTLIAVDQIRPNTQLWGRQLVTLGLIFAGCAAIIWWSKHYERRQPSYAFATSLIRSLTPSNGYSNLNEKQRDNLTKLATSLKAAHTEQLLCTDIFTAYYLFFVERYKNVHMPSSLKYIPGYRTPGEHCSFQKPTLNSIQ